MDNTVYAQAGTLNISLKRADGGISWGFRLQGGIDFSTPLSIQSVQPGSIADCAGAKAGDGILRINNTTTDHLTHEQAKMEIIRSANEINLLVKRGAVTIWKPKVTPLAELRPTELKPVISATGDEVMAVQKTSLAKEYVDETCTIGSSHNRSARPFNNPGAFSPRSIQPVPNVVHAQFNSPISLYSADNLAETYSDQTAKLAENLNKMDVSNYPVGSQIVAGGYRPVAAPSPPGDETNACSDSTTNELATHEQHSTTFGRLEDALNKAEVDTIAKDMPSGFRSVCAPKTDFDAVQKQQQQIQHMRCGGCDMLVT
ncbi:PDZ and LIM domain protein 1 isoform X1 [Octopus bimaculoides]|nr:PDZ and LIM domain protein 1 isoform X1 [Octopus bimaculoides]|eukprot:XP_014769274.1 PREDICTED: PDZ and LIM domain protein 1-like isoform X1 [Octopus bimaculoides]